MFSQRGFLRIKKVDTDGNAITFEKAEEIGIEAGAEEVEEDSDDNENWNLITDPKDLYVVKGHIEKNMKTVVISDYELCYIANNLIELSDEDLEKATQVYDALNEMDEVNKIYANIQ